MDSLFQKIPHTPKYCNRNAEAIKVTATLQNIKSNGIEVP